MGKPGVGLNEWWRWFLWRSILAACPWVSVTLSVLGDQVLVSSLMDVTVGGDLARGQ